MSGKRKSKAQAPDTPSAKKSKTTDDAYNDEDCDVILVSSDGVSFNIHGYYLQAISPVFRTMIQSGPARTSTEAQTVLFTDEALERSAVLKLLLHMACGVHLADFDTLPFDDVADLISLCEKYDCATPLLLLKACLENPVTARLYGHQRFFFACVLNDTELVCRLFGPAAASSWKEGVPAEEASVKDTVKNGCGLDVTTMPTAWLDRLPRKHFLALLRASRLRLDDPPKDWESVGEEFKRLVLLQEKKTAPAAVSVSETT